MKKQIKRRNFLSVLLTTVISIVCVILVLFLAVFAALKITDTDISYLKLDNLYAELVSEDGETKSVFKEEKGLAEKSFLGTTVTLTIPDFNDEYVNKEPTLTKKEKELGYLSVKKDNEGNLVYTMKRVDYEKLILEMKEEVGTQIKTDYIKGNITNITYNDDFSKITVTASDYTLEEQISVGTLSFVVSFYQAFDVDCEIGTTITVVDASGTVLDTHTYPEEQ